VVPKERCFSKEHGSADRDVVTALKIPQVTLQVPADRRTMSCRTWQRDHLEVPDRRGERVWHVIHVLKLTLGGGGGGDTPPIGG